MKRVFIALCVAGLVAILVIQVPIWLASLNTTPPPPPPPEPTEEAQVDSFLEETLPLVGAELLLARDERKGVVRSTWQLSYGTSAPDLTLELQRRAAARGIDVHPIDQQMADRLVQVFGRRDLVHELLLVSAPPRVGTPERISDPRYRPLVSLVLTGLGERTADHIIDLPIPVTLAIQPFQPFSLLLAEQAVHRWHEVLLDLSGITSAGDQPQNALNALPFASGIRIDENLTGEIPTLPMGVLLHPTHIPAPQAIEPLEALVVEDASRLGLETAWARALYSSQTMGMGVLSVPYDHPQIDQVIEWAVQAEDEGYRLVLASEAAREEDIRGPAETDDE